MGNCIPIKGNRRSAPDKSMVPQSIPTEAEFLETKNEKETARPLNTEMVVVENENKQSENVSETTPESENYDS
jgi:hypothetical protein